MLIICPQLMLYKFIFIQKQSQKWSVFVERGDAFIVDSFHAVGTVVVRCFCRW
jgi:hypothetical protein